MPILKTLMVEKTKKGKGPKIDLGDLVISRNFKNLMVGKIKKGKNIKIDLEDLIISRKFKTEVIQLSYKDPNRKPIFDTENNRVIIEFKRRFPDLQLVSRALHKIYFELICLFFGKQEILKDKYQRLRTYIRKPKPGEYWTFAKRSKPMAGDSSSYEFSYIGNYSKECFSIRIFDIEFLINKDNKLPNDELIKDNYEIIDYEIYQIIKNENKETNSEKWKSERIELPYIPNKDFIK